MRASATFLLSALSLAYAATTRVGSSTGTSAPPFATITSRPAPQRLAPAGEPQPLTAYSYAYSAVPYQVNPYPVGRGPQVGFNQCSATTGGPGSMCQTAVVNNVADWCIWGAPGTAGGEIVGNIEAAVVAYCTSDKHGSRVIAPGAITGVQFMRTSAYIQIVAKFDQRSIGLEPNDQGGELDPHGADQLGNPLGGLLYSTGLPSGDNHTYIQAINWNSFVGGGYVSMKVCDPKVTQPNYCENVYDLIGASYNAPANLIDGTFTSCEGDLQDVVGQYVQNGQTMTWRQGDGNPPYQPRVPASSKCTSFHSTDLFAPLSTTAISTTAAAPTPTSAGLNASKSSPTTAPGPASTSTSKTSSASKSLAQGMGWVSVVMGMLVLCI